MTEGGKSFIILGYPRSKVSVTPLTSEAGCIIVRFWVKMNETCEYPSESNRFSVNKGLESNIFALNKKRKLQAEQLGLPIPKHKCRDCSFASEAVSLFDKSPEVESLFINILAEKTEGAAMDGESEQESIKDGNSFAEDSDSALSAAGEAKLQLEYAKTYLVNRPSTSSAVSDRNSLRYTDYSSGSSEDKLVCLSGGKRPSYREFKNLEEHRLGFCNQVDNSCSEYGSNSLDQCIEKELEDIIYSNEVNRNKYVLSSGSWNVNQDAQSGTRKPTIDQEFEQYFSRLML